MSGATVSGSVELDPQTLDHPTLKFLREYWERKRGSHAMPSRADIVPSQLRAHLGWISMVDVIDEGRDFRYRLLGTLVTRYFNWDPTSKTVTEAFAGQPAQLCDAVLGIYRCVVGSRRLVRALADANWAARGPKNERRCICRFPMMAQT